MDKYKIYPKQFRSERNAVCDGQEYLYACGNFQLYQASHPDSG